MKKSEVVQAWASILAGRAPSLSIEITKECPLRCPGCYAFDAAHLGGSMELRELSDFRGDELVGFLACNSHLMDIGGLVDRHSSTDVFMEGLYLPILKIVDGGVLNESLMAVIRANTRQPVETVGDVYSLMSMGTCTYSIIERQARNPSRCRRTAAGLLHLTWPGHYDHDSTATIR